MNIYEFLHFDILLCFRPKMLLADRDDIEMEITLKLKTVADRHTEVTMGFLYGCARNIVNGYWRKKYRERKRFYALYEGDKGKLVADNRKVIAPVPDIDSQLDAIATLRTLPERMVKAGSASPKPSAFDSIPKPIALGRVFSGQ